LLYVVDVVNAQADGGVSLEILCRDLKLDGGWSKPKSRYLRREWLQQIPSATIGIWREHFCLVNPEGMVDDPEAASAYRR
jgi:hypothetical protein